MILFYEQHDIDIPDFNSTYVAWHSRSQHQKDHVIVEHHFRVNIFFCYGGQTVRHVEFN